MCPFLRIRPKSEPGAAVQETDPRKARLRAMFSQLAGADGEIDSEELQDVLTASLTKGKVLPDQRVFPTH